MRRLSLMFMLIAALTACSSGSSDVASTKSASPSAASPTTMAESPPAPVATAPATSAEVAGGRATDFCGAFAQLQKVSATNASPAAMGAAFEAAAADMRKFAPSAIKEAAKTYADLVENIGKAAQGGTLNDAALQKALTDGLSGASADIGKVAVWVGTNCKM